MGEQLSDHEGSGRDYRMLSCDKNVSKMTARVILADSGVTWKNLYGTYHVFKSSVPGVGYAIGVKDPNSDMWIPLGSDWVQTYPIGGQGLTISVGAELRVWYISIDELESNVFVLPQERLVEFRGTESGSTRDYNSSGYIYGSSFEVDVFGCALLEPQVSVPLGRVSAEKIMTHIGAASSAVDFSVPVDCDGQVRLDMVVDGAGSPNASNGVLPLTAGGATGVGIQLLHSDGATPVVLNEAFEVMAATVVGRNDISLAARYIQLSESVVPGVANGVAQFVLSYR